MDDDRLNRIEQKLDTLSMKVDFIVRLAAKTEHDNNSVNETGYSSAAVDDDLYDQAVSVVKHAGVATASLLQRRLQIGYARAARLLDIMDNAGIIGPADGAKPRDVLI